MILVTGSGGHVGGAILEELSSLGLPLFGLTRQELDLAGSLLLENSFHTAPGTIVHLAACVPNSGRYPDNLASADLTRKIDRNVYRAARRWGSRVLYFSTCLLYDRHNSDLKDENSPVQADVRSPYSAAKLEGEELFMQLDDVKIVRLSAPVSAGAPPNLVFNRFVSAALESETLPVFGSGSRRQNFIDVADVASFVSRAFTRGEPGVYNLVADESLSMRELATRIVSVLGTGSVKVLGSDMPDPLEGEYACFSNAKAKAQLDWAPIVSLDQTILRLARAYGF